MLDNGNLLTRHILRRSKRYMYVANKTCGYTPFCKENLDDEVTYPVALIHHQDCSSRMIIFTLFIDIILSLALILSNSLTIITIERSKTLRNCHGMLKMSLAMYDLIMGVFVIPGCIYNKVRLLLVPLDTNFIEVLFASDDQVINKIFGALLTISLFGSMMSLLFLSIDRCRALVSPLTYDTIICKRRTVIVIILVAAGAIFLAVIPLADPQNFHYTADYMTMAFTLEIRLSENYGNTYHGLFFLIIVFVIPYIITLCVTVFTWIIILRDNVRTERTKLSSTRRVKVRPCQEKSGEKLQSGRNNAPGGSERASPQQHLGDHVVQTILQVPEAVTAISKKLRADKDMRRVTCTVTIIIASFSVCVVPFMVVQAENLSGNFDGLGNLERQEEPPSPHSCHPKLYLTFLYLMFFNGLCNFFIYNLRNEMFREELLRLLKFRRHTHPAPPANQSLQVRRCSRSRASSLKVLPGNTSRLE